jgi:hypothetical protein
MENQRQLLGARPEKVVPGTDLDRRLVMVDASVRNNSGHLQNQKNALHRS